MPTQMGITVSEPTSLSNTMGMLVAGSIMRPRIRTSTSMDSPFCAERLVPPLDCFSYQTIWMRCSDPHLHITPWGRRYGLRPGEVDRLVLAAAAGNLAP